VIATAPTLDDGTPFPTLYWLSCPHLTDEVGRVESAGGVRVWAERLAADPSLAESLLRADAEYRDARAAEGGGADESGDVGIAGQSDPLSTKCLHAHVAARLAGIGDPVGEGILASLEPACDDDRCGRGLLQSW
jgi:hypothetical protein